MRSSVIRHPEDEPLLIIRKWQVAFCDGDRCAAALLSYLEYWHNIKVAITSRNARANDIAEAHGDTRTQDETLYQFHTAEDFEQGLLHVYARDRIRVALRLLLDKGAITSHANPNPRYKFDKTRYFLFYPQVVNGWLEDVYPLLPKGWTDDDLDQLRDAKNRTTSAENQRRSPENQQRSPENRGPITEIPLEITNENPIGAAAPLPKKAQIDTPSPQDQAQVKTAPIPQATQAGPNTGFSANPDEYLPGLGNPRKRPRAADTHVREVREEFGLDGEAWRLYYTHLAKLCGIDRLIDLDEDELRLEKLRKDAKLLLRLGIKDIAALDALAGAWTADNGWRKSGMTTNALVEYQSKREAEMSAKEAKQASKIRVEVIVDGQVQEMNLTQATYDRLIKQGKQIKVLK